MVTSNKGVYVLRKASGGSYLYWRETKWRDCGNWVVDKNLANKHTERDPHMPINTGSGVWHCVGELIPLEDDGD